MKHAAKKWYNYIYIILILCALFCGAYLPYKLTNGTQWPQKFVYYTILFGGVVILGVGFVVQDIYRGVIRHRINDWDNKLDEKYINKAWAIFYPMFVSGLISIAVGLFLNLLFK